MPEQSVNFDRAAEYYDATRGFPDGVAPKMGIFVAEQLNLTLDTNLLEVGIGTGRIAVPLAPHVGSITGLDISHLMMGKLHEKPGTRNIHLAAADAHTIPFADNTFDAAYITHVLHLVKDPVRVLEEIKRVIKPGGRFIHMRNRYRNINAMQKIVEAWNAATPEQPKGTKRWHNTDDLLVEAGLILDSEYAFRFPYISKLSDFLDRIEKRQWSSTWLMSDEMWQTGLKAIHKVIEEEFGGNREYESPTEGIFQVLVYKIL